MAARGRAAGLGRRLPRTSHLQRPAGAGRHRHRHAGSRRKSGRGRREESDPRPTRRASTAFPIWPKGMWTVRVEMFGFAPASREVRIPPEGPPPVVELALLPLAEMTRGLPPPVPVAPAAATAPAAPGPGTSSAARGSGQAGSVPARGRGAGPGRAVFNAPPRIPMPPAAASIPAAASAFRDDDNDARNDGGMGAADGLLINGSVNNGAASPFAQARAFGNNRPGGRGLYNGGFGLLTSNSAWDARPSSFTAQPAPKPDYNDVHFVANFGGPIRIPRLMRRGPNFFGGYQRIRITTPTTQSALMPTQLERTGDFSQSRNAFGQPVQVVDPRHRPAVPGQRHPRGPDQPAGGGAARLLPAAERRRASAPTSRRRFREDAAGQRPDAPEHQFRTGASSSRVRAISAHDHRGRQSVLVRRHDADHRISTSTSTTRTASTSSCSCGRAISCARQTNDVTPFFANVTNVSGDAGIIGNNQSPVNWGPPALSFSSGIAGLGTGQYAENTNHTNGASGELFWFRGRHSLTIGGGVRRQAFDVLSQQDAARHVRLHRVRPPGPISPTSSSACRRRARSRSATPTRRFRQNVDRGLRQRRLAGVAGADAQPRRALGVRVADHRGAGTAGEPRRRHRVHRRRSRSSPPIRTGRVTGTEYPASLRPARPARHPAAPRPRLAAGPGLVAGRARAATASIATQSSISRSRCCSRSSRRSRPPSSVADVRGAPLTLANGLPDAVVVAASTPSRSIPTSASALRTTGRCRCSATCRRRSPSSPPTSARRART